MNWGPVKQNCLCRVCGILIPKGEKALQFVAVTTGKDHCKICPQCLQTSYMLVVRDAQEEGLP